MRLKQTRGLALTVSMGIGLSSVGCGGEAPAPEAAKVPTHRTPDSTTVSTAVETTQVSANTSSSTTTTTFSVEEQPRPLTPQEQAENAAIIVSQLNPYFNSLGTTVVSPINENIAPVTQPNELILAYNGCAAIVAVNNYVLTTGSALIPFPLKKLDLVYYGPESIITSGSSFAPENFDTTYNSIHHADPGSLGNQFNPNDPASVQDAVQAMTQTVIAGCTTGVAKNYP